jgi:hypothetical protein
VHLYELLTILAILVGPIAAILIQLAFEKRREDRRRKLRILDTLMAHRAQLAARDAIHALNLIDVTFYDSLAIRQKWAELFTEIEKAKTLGGREYEMCLRKRDDLLTELITLMASSLDYNLPHTLVKGRVVSTNLS